MSARTPVVTRRERRALARAEAPAHRPRASHSPSRSPLRSPLVVASVLAVFLGGVAIVLAGGFTTTASNPDLRIPPTSYAGLPVQGDVIGKIDAPVVLQLYADFQCPACKLFVMTQLPQLIRDFVQPGALRIEANDIDILGRGTPSESLQLAVGAACAADQGRYWQFHDLVFWNQGRENRGDHDARFIAGVAAAADVDMTAFNACIAKDGARAAVNGRTAAALAAGLSSTPTLIVNGQRIVGVPEYSQLKALIGQLASGAQPSTKP